MNFREREESIASLIALISSDTSAIHVAQTEVAKHEESRTQAVYRLVHLMDGRFQEVGVDGYDRVLADLILAEIFKTGVNGAPVSHLLQIVRARFGSVFQSKHVRQALDALQKAGEVIDREHFWFASSMFVEVTPVDHSPADARGRIIKILQDNPEGLPVRAIIAEIQNRYKVAAAQTGVSGVLTKLKQAGRVSHEGKIWRLANAAD